MQAPYPKHSLATFANMQMPSMDTATAAAYLNRKPQTLRIWACYESGPIRPIRINGRLAWRTDDVRRLLQLEIPNRPLQA